MIPTYLVYLSIPIGGALMSFRFVQLLWNFIYRRELSQNSEEAK
jgi:TRAP-type C4-dicarboxylate transport system permease small subunit